MACVSKLLQAKVWFLLANVQLTTVSVEPWVHIACNVWTSCNIKKQFFSVLLDIFSFLCNETTVNLY